MTETICETSLEKYTVFCVRNSILFAHLLLLLLGLQNISCGSHSAHTFGTSLHTLQPFLKFQTFGLISGKKGNKITINILTTNTIKLKGHTFVNHLTYSSIELPFGEHTVRSHPSVHVNEWLKIFYTQNKISIYLFKICCSYEVTKYSNKKY